MCGKDFEEASVKLMAGDVAPRASARRLLPPGAAKQCAASSPLPSSSPDGAFDEYHLYTLPRPPRRWPRGQTGRVRACRQVFPSERIYVYDGFQTDSRYNGWNYESLRTRLSTETQSNTKVWAMLEFRNSEKSQLGLPLPKAR